GSTTPAASPSASAIAVASTTPGASTAPGASTTPVASATPAASAIATPSEDTSLARLDDDLKELEADLGDRLSDDTKADLARVRTALDDLMDFSSGLQTGAILPGSHV